MRFPGGPGFGFYSVVTDVVGGLLFILAVVVVVGLIVILVRFLLVATRAAEIYIAKNRPSEGVTSPGAPAPVTPPAEPVTTGTLPTTPTLATTPRTRTPKPPVV